RGPRRGPGRTRARPRAAALRRRPPEREPTRPSRRARASPRGRRCMPPPLPWRALRGPCEMPECVHLLERGGERHAFAPRDDGNAHLLVAPPQGLTREAPEPVSELGGRCGIGLEQLERGH